MPLGSLKVGYEYNSTLPTCDSQQLTVEVEHLLLSISTFLDGHVSYFTVESLLQEGILYLKGCLLQIWFKEPPEWTVGALKLPIKR